MPEPIPQIDVAPLFGSDAAARDATDAAIRAAARDVGFLVLANLPPDVPLGPAARDELLRVLSLPPALERPLWRRAAAPENPNVYRGFFPLEIGFLKRGIDIGPERAPSADGDALAEPTPLPDASALLGWRDRMRASFAALERVAGTLMCSLARGLGLPERRFDAAFEGGNSTLRMLEYPPWPELAGPRGWPVRPLTSPGGVRRYAIGGEHVDSGFVTLLQQDTLGGLQARLAGDAWVDVPPVEGSLVVNFGKLLERWTGGRIRATEHRVLGNDRTRRSIPFFYEPRVDARIEPLPLAGVPPFEPFTYGDHVWEAIARFPEFANATRFPAPTDG